MSSFLSAAENVARQRQNVRRDLKKEKEEESRADKLALENHNMFFFFFFFFFFFLVCAVQERCFNYSKTIIFIFLEQL